MLLDLDDTLIEEESFARAQLRSTAAVVDGLATEGWDEVVIEAARSQWYESPFFPACADLGIASWEGLWATFAGTHPRLDGLAEWIPAYRREAWRAALRAAGRTDDASLDTDADAMSAHYIAAQRAGHPLLPGAVDLVRRLSAAVPVAIVTNGPPDIQRLKIEHAGVAPFLSAVVISGEIGVGKPHPDIFRAALDQLGVPAGRAVMVGDNWERDVCGALGAGVGAAVWISQGRVPPVRGADDDGPDAGDDRITVARGPAEVSLL